MSVESNMAIVRGLIAEVWNGHDLDAVARYFGPAMVEESVEHTRQFLAAFPDLQVIIEDLFGAGDRLVGRLTLRGTQLGAFAGRAATGRGMEITSLRIYRFEDGRIAENWAMQDRLGLMQQLGFLPEVGSVAGAAQGASAHGRAPTGRDRERPASRPACQYYCRGAR